MLLPDSLSLPYYGQSERFSLIRTNNPQTIMTELQLSEMLDRMESGIAGSFYTRLAQALRVADRSNRSRLLAAFPEIVKNYGPGSMHDMQNTARSLARTLLN